MSNQRVTRGSGRPWAAALLVAVVAAVLAGPVLGDDQLLTLQLALVYALFATATNLLLGYTGLLSFGQAVFFGFGAYVVAVGWDSAGLSFWALAPLALVATTVLSLVIGAAALRSQKFYFGLLTLAFSQLFFTLARQLYGLTSGDTGLFGAMVPDLLADPVVAFRATLAVVAVALVALWLVCRSPFGMTLRAIRENRQRVQALGVNVYGHQLAAFTIAGGFTGLAGVLFVVGQQAAYPSLLDWQQSGIPVFMALIGGMRWFAGPIVGAFVFQYGRDALVTHTSHWQAFFGILILAVVLAAPGGLVGGAAAVARTVRSRLRRQSDRIVADPPPVPAAVPARHPDGEVTR